MPSHLPAELRRVLEPIALLVLDVDGVLTDGILHITAEGEELKRFHVRDGLGIRLLLEAGVKVAILSGRASAAVARRAQELGLDGQLVIQGSRDKAADLATLLERSGVGADAAAAMGDDVPDLPMLTRVSFAACPADAAPEVAAVCHHICRADGGRGAVRELAELILKAKRRWIDLTDRWTVSEEESGGRSGT